MAGSSDLQYREGTFDTVQDQDLTDRPSAASLGRRSDYAELSREVKQARLLERRPGYYAAKIGLTALLVAAGWTAFLQAGDSWYQLATAAYLAIVFTQAGFLGHDAGHRQIFRTRRANDIVGLIAGNLVIGLSYGWWVSKHNRHHSHPNHLDLDPDIAIGVLAFTAEQARAKRGLARTLSKYQAYLFFPLLLLEGAQLHEISVRAVFRGGIRWRPLEALLLLSHFVGYLAALLLVLSPLRAVVFVVVHQGLFGLYMGCVFAPNHKGMPVIDQQTKLDYLRRQVRSSRNVRVNRFTGFLFGGLNYQIEHHLFPSMPRPNLRRSQAIIRTFCQQRGLPYCESSVLESYQEVLRHLHAVSASLLPRVH